jgi:hypothetical protein
MVPLSDEDVAWIQKDIDRRWQMLTERSKESTD